MAEGAAPSADGGDSGRATVEVEGARGGVAVVDGGSSGGQRRRWRMEAVVADGGDGGGWRWRCGDGAGGHGGCRVDGYYDVTAYSTIYNISTTKIPALSLDLKLFS